MATVKEKVAGIKEMGERVEAGVAEIQRGIKQTTDVVEAGTKEIKRGIKQTTNKVKVDVTAMTGRFDKYAKEDFWG